LDLTYIPPLLLQTFVENTIKYEVLPGEKTYIHLQVSRQADSLHLLVWDTGEGYSQESLDYLASQGSAPADESGRRIGLTNLRQRILLLFGADRSNIGFSNRDGAGAQMEITLPYLDKWEDER
jgi:two-component system sensor histidine kinase YesM